MHAKRIVLLVVLAACAATRPHAKKHWRWAEPRADYVRRSQVWLGGDLDGWVRHMRTLDVAAGPDRAFEPEALVRCTYVEPRHESIGHTPKFECRRDRDVLKVKWGEDNAEIYAEVAGTRLLWALGFGADREYPVRVECTDCEDDPWRDRKPHPGHVAVFAPAVVELKFPGRTIAERRGQGWTWGELGRVDPAAGGAPHAHTDAFRLLAAFIQHRDSKADNQRLVCLADGVTTAPDGRRDCRKPFLLIQDLGSSFGGPALFATHKMSLDAWRAEPVWKDARRCVASVTSERDARDGLDDPRIGEDGRRFLATLLSALDERQIAALFTVARAERRGDVAAWVATFRAKRDEIVHPVPDDPRFRCPEP